MNTLNESQKKTQNGYLGSKARSQTFAYIVGNGIYINLTNRCTNDCTFCLRNNGDTAYLTEKWSLIPCSESFDRKNEQSIDEFVNKYGLNK